MKNISLSFLLLIISSFSFAQGTQVGNLQINELFTERYSAEGNAKILGVNKNGLGATSVAIFPKKQVPAFSQHLCGNMWVFNTILNWGNPFNWEVNVQGTIYPYQINKINDAILIVGYFSDSIRANNTTYYAIDSIRASSFILSLNANTGMFNWIKLIQDSIYNSVATSVSALSSGNLLVSTLHQDIESAIYKLDSKTGNIISSKIFPNVRTIASVLERNNVVYVAGSASDFANIDTFTVRTQMNTGYANFMFKADTNLNLLYLESEPYITFDFSSHLEMSNSSVLWSFYKQNNSQGLTQSFNLYRENDTLVDRLSLSTTLSLSEYDNRLIVPTDMSGYLLFKRDGLDYNLYHLNFGSTSYYEKITTGTSVELYDVSTDFLETVVSGSFGSDTLFLLNHQIPNPYFSANQTCDFLSFYHEIYGGIHSDQKIDINSFPNPASEVLNIVSDNVQYVSILNVQGQLLNTFYSTNKIDIHQLPSGIYLIKGYTTDKQFSIKFIKK